MIFVTGGTGLLGSHILKTLEARGQTTTALVRNSAGARAVESLGAIAVHGSVHDPATWRQVGDCHAIVHSAALIAAREPWDTFERVNVRGTALAAQRAREFGVPLVHISSVAVYGRSAADDAGDVGEDYQFRALATRDYYARSKRLAEAAVWEEVGRGLSACALRPCVVYGERDRLFLPSVVKAARRGWLPRIGAGNRPMALVHAQSVAEAVLCALDSNVAWGRPFNVTNDDDVTPRQLIEAVAEGLGRPLRTLAVPTPLALASAGAVEVALRLLGPGRYPGTLTGAVRFWRGGNPYHSRAARELLQWRPTVHHRSAIPAAVRHIVAQGSRQPRPA